MVNSAATKQQTDGAATIMTTATSRIGAGGGDRASETDLARAVSDSSSSSSQEKSTSSDGKSGDNEVEISFEAASSPQGGEDSEDELEEQQPGLPEQSTDSKQVLVAKTPTLDTEDSNPKETTSDDDNAEEGGNGGSTTQQHTQKPEMNKDFQDVVATGKWGKLSKTEICVAGGLVVAVVVAIVVIVVVLFVVEGGRTNKNPAVPQQVPAAEAAASNMFASPEDEYNTLLKLLEDNPQTRMYLDALPAQLEDLKVMSTRDTRRKQLDDPVIRAAAWIVLADDEDVISFLPERFALASLYYATNGDDWTSSENWLDSAQSHCDWEHVHCRGTTPQPRLQELDLSHNHLQGGPLPATLALLTDVAILWLNDNVLTGEIPGDTFGSLPNLTILYLQNNELTGEIPEALVTGSSGTLSTLFVQGNTLEGSWPEAFCPQCAENHHAHALRGRRARQLRSDCTKPLAEYRLNCTQTPCPEGCCFSGFNCFD